MARPVKTGLDYFPFDVDYDAHPKVKMLLAKHGEKGYIISIKLLSWIYQHNGYYMKWDEMTRLLFVNSVILFGYTETDCKEVVDFLIKWQFFDIGMYEKHNILTNARCQKTYLEGSRKRKNRTLSTEFSLVEGFPAEETPENGTESTQRKGKERKGKKRKGKEYSPTVCFELVLRDPDYMENVDSDQLEKFTKILELRGGELKTLADFKAHFVNWMQYKTQEMPTGWDKEYYNSLDSEGLIKYSQYLTANGWQRVTGANGTSYVKN